MPIYPTRKIVRPKDRGVFMRMCILQSKEGNTNVESTMAEVDKDVEKRTQYNRIRRKTLMISVTTPTYPGYWWKKEER